MPCATISSALARQASRRFSLKQQRRELSQIAPPDHPGVLAGRFDISVAYIFGLEPLAELAVDFDQPVLGAASDPQQA